MTPLSTTAFSQRALPWANDRLGASSLTLGQAGCLVTALASLLADWGTDTDPGRLNGWLTATGGYVCGNRVRYGAVGGLGARPAVIDDCFRHRAPVSHVRNALRDGLGVVALIDTPPGRASRAHWVRLVRVTGSDALIMDPWQAPGAELVDLSARYGGPGWGLAQAVYVYVGYERAGGRARSVTPCGAGMERAEQGVVCVRR